MAFWDKWFQEDVEDVPFNPNERISDTSFSDLKYQDQGGVHPPLGFPRNTGNLNYNIHQDPPRNWRDDIDINKFSQYPGSVYQDRIMNENLMNMDRGNITNQGFQFPSILTALANKLKREPNPVLDAELAALEQNKGYLDTGEFVGRYGDGKYDMYDSITTPEGTEDIQILRGKNEPGKSFAGSETFEEAKEKKFNWVRDRLLKGKPVGSDILRWYRNTSGSSDRFTDDNRLVKPSGTITVGDNVNQGGSTYGGPQTYDFNPSQFAKSGGQRPDKPGGFTDPGKGSYGPHMAYGGRIGYANGEFVDEDVNIQGPNFDVNENIEMTSGGGEGDILEQLVAKYIEAGFPPEQAQEMAMQELQQMVAQSGQGEGIASLV